jgi:hypothetical protein
MIEISKNLADCIMPNHERINFYQLTANWTKQYCQLSNMGSTAAPENRPEPTENTDPSHTEAPGSQAPFPTLPLPTLSSSCANSNCKAEFTACEKIFDSCACFPGQLTCVKTNCPDDWEASLAECQMAMALAETCVLHCAAGIYPNKALDVEGSTVVIFTVVASIEMSGISIDEFNARENAFRAALAVTLDCNVETVQITNVTEVTGRRDVRALKPSMDLGVRQLQLEPTTASYLNIEFEVTALSATNMNVIASTLQGRCHIYYTYVKR